VTTGGCSFFVVRPTPTADPETGTPECSSVLAPVLDVVGAAGLGLGALWFDALAHGLGECGKYAGDWRCGSHVELYLPAVVVGVSSIYGFWAAGRCHSRLVEDQRAAGLAALDRAIEARRAVRSERPELDRGVRVESGNRDALRVYPNGAAPMGQTPSSTSFR